MSEFSAFWEGNVGSGDPGDVGPYSAAQYATFLFYAAYDQLDGILSDLAVIASSPNAKSVDVRAGAATIQGYYYVLDANTTLTITDNISGLDRIDRIILRCDWTAQEIRLDILEGKNAASPVPLALTQTPGTLYEIALAQVYVTNGFSTITDADITRERTWVRRHPPGVIQPDLRLEVPDGWALCDGSEVSRTTYRDLFDAIGTTYGVGDGSTTFNLPDLRGRAFAGLDNMGGTDADVVTDSSAESLGGTLGEEAHTLVENELPAHTHDVQNIYVNLGGAYGIGAASAGDANATRTSDATGGDQPHNTMQPTLFGNWIIKT